MYNRLTLHLNKVLSLITMLVLFSSGSMLAQGFSSITPLNSIGITASTDEKPQSKVWTHDGKWWMVMPNSSGTHIFRLDGTTWTSVLNIDPSTNVHADCKVVGNVTHILLYKGENSSLVSVEYSSNTYQLWSSRSTTSPISLDSGVSTATIDIDGNGRMWLASDAGSEINVRWSDTPYTTWSAPITIESGVNNDDICLVTEFDGKIGVLWSNQNTQRFGFKYHIDGDPPTAWSIDEVPVSQSAQNQGFGMADDHLNIAVASDGTLYTAIKTSYNTYGFPRIALLVRRPSGNWDNLYEVSQYGTRPIAILNEVEGKIKILYTSFENSGDILYKESPIPNISFSSVFTLINGSNNNASSTKQNYTDEVVVLASTGSVLSSVIASDLIGTSPPSTPLLVLPNDHSSEIAIAPTLKWEAVGTADSYHVQVSTQSDFTTLVHDQSNITSTSTTLFPELANNTEYYWRVNATNTYGNSDWSSVWSFTTGLLGDHLMAHWEMDNSQGTVLEDATYNTPRNSIQRLSLK